MPRYFFHLHSDPDAIDEEGHELPDIAAAGEYAMEAARDMVCADIKQGWLNLDHSIEVADDRGAVLFTITFREAFEPGNVQAVRRFKTPPGPDTGRI